MTKRIWSNWTMSYSIETRQSFLRRRRQRGSAMTELVICIVPYAFLVLGVTLIGHLALGKQEAYKAVAWASPYPDEQTSAEVDDRFYYGVKGETDFEEALFETEEDMAAYRAADPAEEEAVLPYDADDMVAAVTNSAVHVGHSVSVEGGQPTVTVNVTATREGQEMSAGGIVDMSGVTGSTVMDPGQLGEMDLSFDVNEEICEEMASILGSWLFYSRSEAMYKYGLNDAQGGLYRGEGFHGEDEEAGRTAFRDTYEVRGKEDNPDEYAFYAASVNLEGDRGNHHDDSVDREPFHELDTTGGGIYPDQMDDPLMDREAADKAFWNRTSLEE